MLEITSNFRICLDLFKLASFGTNYGLQTADEEITNCTKVDLRYFGPFPALRCLEMIDTFIFFVRYKIERRRCLTNWDPEILVGIVR